MAGLRRAAAAEAVGTFVFFTIGAGAVIVETSPSFGQPLGLLGVAAAHGLVLAVMVTAFARVSGGHFNPAVTFSVWIGGKIEGPRALVYVVAQIVGAVAAAGLLRVMFLRADWAPSNLGSPALASGVSVGRAIVIEAALTLFLVLAVWGTGIDRRGAVVGGLGIGLAVFVDILVGGPLTGAAMNPARHLGPALVSGELGQWWIFWVGPLAGGALGAVLYKTAFWDDASS